MPIFMDQIRRLLGIGAPTTAPATGDIIGPVDAPADAGEMIGPPDVPAETAGVIGPPDIPAEAPPMGILPQEMPGGPYADGATSVTTGGGAGTAETPIFMNEAGVIGEEGIVANEAGVIGEEGIDAAKAGIIGEDGLGGSVATSEAAATGALRTTETAPIDFDDKASAAETGASAPQDPDIGAAESPIIMNEAGIIGEEGIDAAKAGVIGEEGVDAAASNATPDPWGTDASKEGKGGDGDVEPDDGQQSSQGDASLDDEGPSTLLDDGGLVTDTPALDSSDLESLAAPDLDDIVEP